MATYVKGSAVANATSYELLENSDGTYTSLATASEINFEVSALGLAAGDHVLVVKAKADGYEDSDYSNEVTYTVEGESGGDTVVLLDTELVFAAGAKLNKQVPFTTNPTADCTAKVLLSDVSGNHEGSGFNTYINADTTRAVSAKIGTEYSVDLLSTDTKLWVFNSSMTFDEETTFRILVTV